MNFRTRLDITNRQVKQLERTDVSLSGSSVFGLPFSALTTGPSQSVSGISETVINVVSTFSGNTGTTVFTFGDSRMNLAATSFSAITPSNSAITQDSGNVWTGNTSQIVDGNFSYLDYSGVSFPLSIETMTETSPNVFTGSCLSDDVFILSADTLDFTGRAIWVDNPEITRTNKLIVSDGAISGYVLKSDSEGMATWQVDASGSTFTGNTSATCISDIFVSNIHSCSPLNINPLDEGDVFFGSTSGVTIDVINSRIGVGKSPDYPLDIVVGSAHFEVKENGSAGNVVMMSGGTTGLTQVAVTADSLGGSIGVRGGADTIFAGYGKQGDMFLYSGIDSNGLNIISQPSSGTDDFIRFFAGQAAGADGTPDLYIHGSGATRGYVALGHSTPTEILDVLGSIKMVDGNETNGYVMTSDGNGVATWQASLSGGTSPWSAGTGTDSAVLIGGGNIATGITATAEGTSTTASGDYSHAEGQATTASGTYSHAEGRGSEATNLTSHAEGQFTIASGLNSHSEGGITVASGDYSHAEGNTTIASGDNSHAEGLNTSATTFHAHAEGQSTLADGNSAHAEGLSTVASGDYSHAEGQGSTSSGLSSHAEGNSTEASGQFSHSEGNGTEAIGAYSHAGGIGSVASGVTSFIHSTDSLVTGDRSVVLGGQNITGTTADMVYVPDLVIDGLTSVTDLQTDSTGQVIDGASDVTLKNEITPIYNPLDKILKLKPVSFEWVPEMNLRTGTVFGLIAQEVQEVLPEIVRERAKGNGTLTLEYKEIIPWLIGAVQELASGSTVRNELILETQTIASEDNNIELNYGGNHDTAIGGGVKVLDAIKDGVHSEIKTDENGGWVVSPSLSTPKLILPEYTPTSTNDESGVKGDTVWNDDYIYIKTNAGWRRSSLENF